MRDVFAELLPFVMCAAAGWCCISFSCGWVAWMIFEDDMRREDESNWREHGHGSPADPRLR